MAFSREYSDREKSFMIEWQHVKSPGMMAYEMNQWDENQTDPRTSRGVRDFIHRRRQQEAPIQ